MDVSVVIPLYNGSPWIGETLESVLAQTHPPQEIFVVDDGSTDGSLATARSYSQTTVLENPGDGAGAARDFGLQHVSAPLVAFLDQDDLWHSDHLRFLADRMSTVPEEVPAAIAKDVPFWAASEPEYDVSTTDTHLYDPWKRFPLNSIASPSCAVIRRRALEDLGGWPQEYCTSDFHAWFKLSVPSPFLRTARRTVGKRRHDENTLQKFRQESLRYFHHRLDVCRDALDYRLRQDSSNGRVYQHRLETFEAIGRILEGVLCRDRDQVHHAVQTLDDSDIDRSLQRSFAHFAMSMFEPQFAQSPTEERDFLLRTVHNWPSTCPTAREIFFDAVSRTTLSGWSFLACFLHQPHRVEAWLLLLRALNVRFRRRLSS